MPMAYDQSFFDLIRPGCQKSAEIVVTEFLREYHPSPKSVIDVGCGEGWWGHEFKKRGSFVVGVDGDGFHSPDKADLDEWREVNLESELGNELVNVEKFELAICLEVAEHLTPFVSDDLVRYLCNLSNLVMFSAAIPMQGGLGHVNEQWPNYWANKFNHLGYQGWDLGNLFWGNPNVEPWYQQNLYVFENIESYNSQDFYPKIHPAFWATRTGAELP